MSQNATHEFHASKQWNNEATKDENGDGNIVFNTKRKAGFTRVYIIVFLFPLRTQIVNTR